MVLSILLYLILLFTSAAVTLVLSVVTWRHRRSAAARLFFYLAVDVTIWSLLTGIANLSWPGGLAEIWFRMKFLPVAFSSAFFLAFVLHHTSWGTNLSQERLLALFVIPVLTQVVVWTNNLHGLMYQELSFLSAGGYTIVNTWEPGIWYWLHTVYHYALIGCGLILVFVTMHRPSGPYRVQAWSLFLGSVFGIGANAITTLELGLVFDITPVGFTLMCLIWSWSLLQYRLVDLGAVARARLVESLDEAVILLDHHNRIVDVNPAAAGFLMDSREAALGQPADAHLKPWKKLVRHFETGGAVSSELTLIQSGLDYEFALSILPVENDRGELNGRLICLRDITGRKQVEESLKRANRNLMEEIRERKNAERSIFELATVDPLTQLNNRKHFLELAEREFKRSVRYKRGLSAILLDVDHFKRVNDECGYRTGDQVLSALATRITKYLRSTDIVGRFGGEEFVFLLPETGYTHAEYVAERLRQEIDLWSVPTDQGHLHITVSIGIASLDDEVKSVDKLLDLADQALAQAKEAGRNRVMVYAGAENAPQT